MRDWYFYALTTVVVWGIWGVFSKLASAHSKPRQMLIFQSVGVIAFALVVLALEKFRIEPSMAGFRLVVRGGILYVYRVSDIFCGAGAWEGVDGGDVIGFVSGGDDFPEYFVSA